MPTRPLSQGDSGDDVRWLQSSLKSLGGDVIVTGYFGSMTRACVVWYQARKGIQQTGTCGSQTRAAILADLSSASTDPNDPAHYPVPTRTLTQGDSGDDVRWLQAALKKLGADLPITGYFGSQTKSKVKAFQGSHGLSKTGVCDAVTRNRIAAALLELDE